MWSDGSGQDNGDGMLGVTGRIGVGGRVGTMRTEEEALRAQVVERRKRMYGREEVDNGRLLPG